MKLLRLKINNAKGFRSLKRGFEVHFPNQIQSLDEFSPFVLAGRNGSGKSNILEALAEIFYHLDGIYLSYKPDYFEETFDSKTSRINSYELEYYIPIDKDYFPSSKENPIAHVEIIKKAKEQPSIKIKNSEELGMVQFKGFPIKSLLPDYVVGYASGLNETLSIPFFKSRILQYDRYFHSLESRESIDISPENSLLLVDEQMAQAIMVTCLLMFDNPFNEEKSKLLEPFREYVKLEEIDSFRLIFRTDLGFEFDKSNSSRIKKEYDKSKTVRLIHNLDLEEVLDSINSNQTRSYIEKLKRCATSWQNIYDVLGPYEEELKGGSREYIVFDFKVNKATKRAFQLHFEHNPLKLFEFFQTSYILNNNILSQKSKNRAYRSENPFITYDIAQLPLEEDRIIRFKDLLIKKSDIPTSFFTKNLSDGEFQFIHTLGICLLFRNSNALILLDEPETHFNPDWKSKYISSIKKCLEINGETTRNNALQDILITTHSPFLISDSKKENVFVFRKGNVSHPEIKTFGTSVNILTEEIFEKTESISDLSLDVISKIKELKFETIEDILEAKEQARVLGESVEKVLLFRELILKERSLKN